MSLSLMHVSAEIEVRSCVDPSRPMVFDGEQKDYPLPEPMMLVPGWYRWGVVEETAVVEAVSDEEAERADARWPDAERYVVFIPEPPTAEA